MLKGIEQPLEAFEPRAFAIEPKTATVKQLYIYTYNYSMAEKGC